ncbi:patatin-like phospholipase family protein [Virgibacillus sp. SK37]|uniref:patatin-like phospholipase family protein n=1 Tax=Virgibacillus sp. SK37 TaxID=403957 RepID=UPI0004D18E9C|nr:patatin-like phospholipase family protein [Virgibacillus sp. SK37]AIF43456.1 hypothetical protein X953_10265 [Virgibacillus sp. SK37]
MEVDAVFSGGGIKAFAFLGALESMENKGLEIRRCAGTSAGAIVASFIAAGYTNKEIFKLISNLELTQFFDPPVITKIFPLSKWFYIYFKLGINKGDKLEKWLYTHLANKNVYTFKDIPLENLKIVVSDISLGKLVVIPDDLKRIYDINPDHFPISKAVRMSAGFPYFFMPKRIQNKTTRESLIVDGGLLSNFPLWIFEKERDLNHRPILGIKLEESNKQLESSSIDNAIDMFYGLFSTMKQAHDTRYITKSEKNNIITIPVENQHATNLHINNATKERLIQDGREHAEQFLRFWPK